MTISSVKLSSVKFSCVVFFLSFAMSGCGGGGTDSHTKPPPVSQDNSLYTVTKFANKSNGDVKVLRNGNFIVYAYFYSKLVENGGAVFLYSPDYKEPIASFNGDDVGDTIGSNKVLSTHGDYYDGSTEGIVELANDNFVIASPRDSSNGLQFNGSVMLINGQTGEQIGSTFYGENDYDGMGFGIYPLSNGNFMVSSPYAHAQGIKDTGSVFFVDGNTGQQIGETITGQHQDDYLGYSDFYVPEAVRILPNGNILIVSQYADSDEFFGAGSAMLIDGQSYQQIGNTIFGSEYNGLLGRGGIKVLANSNIMLGSEDSGLSVKLIDGISGEIIKDVLSGISPSIALDYVVELGNGNAIVKTEINNKQFLKLLNTRTGEVQSMSAAFPYDVTVHITPLPNHNVVVSAYDANVDGVEHAGVAMLFDGETGQQIGEPLRGSIKNDSFAYRVVPLQNNNVVIASPAVQDGEFQQAGSLMLLDGASWQPLMPTIYGTHSDEFLGQSLTLLSNNKVTFLKGAKDSSDTDSRYLAVLDGEVGTLLGEVQILDRLKYEYAPHIQELDNDLLAVFEFIFGSSTGTASLRLYDIGNSGNFSDISTQNMLSGIFSGCGDDGSKFIAVGQGYYVCFAENASAFILDSETGKQVGDTITTVSGLEYARGKVLPFPESTNFLLSLPSVHENDPDAVIYYVKIK